MRKFLALIAVFIVFLSVNSFAVAPYTLTGLTATDKEIDLTTHTATTEVELTCYGGDGASVFNQPVTLKFYDQIGQLLFSNNTLCGTGVGTPFVSGPILKPGLYYVVAELPPASGCADTGGCKQKAWFSVSNPFVQMQVPDNNVFFSIAVAFGVIFIVGKK